MSLTGKMNSAVARFSKYNGFKLTWKLESKNGLNYLVIEDPTSEYRNDSKLTLTLSSMGLGLREVYGRIRHLGATAEDQALMVSVLKELSNP